MWLCASVPSCIPCTTPVVILVSHEQLELCSKTDDVSLQFSIGIVLIVETLVEVVDLIAEETIAIDGIVSLTSAEVEVRLKSTLFSPCKICFGQCATEVRFADFLVV
jgi:hypothetical protein